MHGCQWVQLAGEMTIAHVYILILASYVNDHHLLNATCCATLYIALCCCDGAAWHIHELCMVKCYSIHMGAIARSRNMQLLQYMYMAHSLVKSGMI